MRNTDEPPVSVFHQGQRPQGLAKGRMYGCNHNLLAYLGLDAWQNGGDHVWVPAFAGTTISRIGASPTFVMQFWIVQTLNSLALGGLLFLLAAGFSLIFGLMRIANLTHGSLFMLGAYLGVTALQVRAESLARRAAGRTAGRRCLAGCSSGSFCVRWPATRWDRCWSRWASRSSSPTPASSSGAATRSRSPAPASLQRPIVVGNVAFPAYRLVVLGIAIVTAIALHLLMERTRLGAMIRAGVDDMQMARAVGIPVSRLFTTVFCLGAGLSRARAA